MCVLADIIAFCLNIIVIYHSAKCARKKKTFRTKMTLMVLTKLNLLTYLNFKNKTIQIKSVLAKECTLTSNILIHDPHDKQTSRGRAIVKLVKLLAILYIAIYSYK